MSFNSVNGNEGFSNIRNVTRQIPNLNASDVKSTTLTTGSVVGSVITGKSFGSFPNGKLLKTVELETSSTNLSWMINNGYSLALNISGTSTPFQFKTATSLVAATITGIGLVEASGDAQISIGIDALSNPNTLPAQILTSSPYLTVNTGLYVSSGMFNVFGTTGYPNVLNGQANYYITLGTTNGGNFTQGKVIVTLTYFTN